MPRSKGAAEQQAAGAVEEPMAEAEEAACVDQHKPMSGACVAPSQRTDEGLWQRVMLWRAGACAMMRWWGRIVV